MADNQIRQESILSCGHCTEYEQVSRRDFLVGTSIDGRLHIWQECRANAKLDAPH